MMFSLSFVEGPLADLDRGGPLLILYVFIDQLETSVTPQ